MLGEPNDPRRHGRRHIRQEDKDITLAGKIDLFVGGALIAREVADVTVAAEGLRESVLLKRLADGLMARIRAITALSWASTELLSFWGVPPYLSPPCCTTAPRCC